MPITGRMVKISHALADAQYASARPASELHEHISLFCAYPAARELPELLA
jgi:hypothetical protein